MMKKRRTKKDYLKKVLFFVGILVLIIALITILHFFSPEEIVQKIGLKNAYILMFLIAFFGGFSAWISFSFVATLVMFSAGGANPLILGLVSGLGLSIGDVIMFFLGVSGRSIIVGKWDKRLKKASSKVKRIGNKWIAFFSYIYIGFTPLPNDFLLIFLAMMEFPPKKIYLPIILGDFTYSLLIAFFALKVFFLFG